MASVHRWVWGQAVGVGNAHCPAKTKTLSGAAAEGRVSAARQASRAAAEGALGMFAVAALAAVPAAMVAEVRKAY